MLQESLHRLLSNLAVGVLTAPRRRRRPKDYQFCDQGHGCNQLRKRHPKIAALRVLKNDGKTLCKMLSCLRQARPRDRQPGAAQRPSKYAVPMTRDPCNPRPGATVARLVVALDMSSQVQVPMRLLQHLHHLRMYPEGETCCVQHAAFGQGLCAQHLSQHRSYSSMGVLRPVLDKKSCKTTVRCGPEQWQSSKLRDGGRRLAPASVQKFQNCMSRAPGVRCSPKGPLQQSLQHP
mmetsp:Transcript_93067/g.178729  ORF Transcript_93067/g.178729 Transcript_93067/m.178729 type:complete len:234 (-) Transcript_93067:455-1156(-)